MGKERSSEKIQDDVLTPTQYTETPKRKRKDVKVKIEEEATQNDVFIKQEDPALPAVPLKKVKIEPISVKPRVKAEPREKGVITEDIVEPIDRWWEKVDNEFDLAKIMEYENQSCHWEYLEHNGMIFTPEYKPHGIPIKFKGEPITLTPDLEEVATFWAQSIGTNYEESEIYRRNFWNTFTSMFPKGHVIRKSKATLKDCDFSEIRAHLDMEREKKKEQKEYYKALKEETAKKEHPYCYALVDWIREKVGSNRMEPPGLFKGRGLHPKQGLLKGRTFPHSVVLNLSKDAPVPKVSMFERQGHGWSDIFHDSSVTWLAYYRDTVNDQTKYMYPAAQSKFKGLHDFLKYSKARELKKHIMKIRKDYHGKMRSPEIVDRQLGTATYLIDFLALRVGGEKDADEADTVGCCSLRVEHIKFDRKPNTITLDFLGKDSIRYFHTVTLDEVACRNLSEFCKKKPTEDIFDKINTVKLNDYLKDLMTGLTAKVFRTYNASITLCRQLRRLKVRKSLDSSLMLQPGKSDDDLDKPVLVDVTDVNELISFYNEANRRVAILCNHQRSIPKQHESSMSKMQAQAELISEEIAELQAYMKYLESNQTKPFTFESRTVDAKGNPRKAATRQGMKLEACQKKLETAMKRSKVHAIKMRIKDDNKTVALGTSKINYMDPRITVAFCKRYEVPIEKIFNKSLRTKFPWAMYAGADYIF
ncbi:Eukaryotic DNA topoisomerase I catalytic core family protein [Babesia bovis T2Bo]|uniref:DNA topoisomerase I n=2 Tax=Babesia bovis TaxID=5865 RepID=A7AUT4_BABBO|nr:Eukaryotic DNA topoisomerase I catalytic core family protein [Babesia bovis T2Bo]EDO06695.1 Eukaryotic DNA topoisomerase I catalytic core family protein [Babesia bovis T2Bo]|eukprot:XP_001610263.1 DNA topoisomerase [Babesia bovis T2Bo]